MSWIILFSIRYLRCLEVMLGYFCLMIGYNFSNDFHFVYLITDMMLLSLFI
jgi:hypothetical protein